MAKIETIRFRRPEEKPKPAEPPKLRHGGILQDQLRRTARPPWCPSFSMAVRILLLVRVSAAMYANIQDCDEVFNFWEPLHYLDKGHGFQTWETSPVYAIRSWAYIILHLIPARILAVVLRETGKRPAFFTVRTFLAVVSSLCEARLYTTVKEKINNRVARYFLFMMVTSAGMWNASIAFLPSSFAMYTITLACSYAFVPASQAEGKRTLAATLLFATGALVGWPFALAVAIPFVIEELFLYAGDRVRTDQYGSWLINRWTRLLLCGAAAVQIAIPVMVIDTYFYGKITAVPWNIVKYNVFPDAARGPTLYGTEPPSFYIMNLLLNFNVLLPLALLSIPGLFVTYRIDRRRLGFQQGGPENSSPFTLLGLRLLPMYLWMAILTIQPHKEERFMFPIYPLICFNAAVSVYLMRGWMEVAFVKITKSPYRASKTSIFSVSTLSIIAFAAIVSLTRILALWKYYHTPMTVFYQFEADEVPRLLNTTGLLPQPLPPPLHMRSAEEIEKAKYTRPEEPPRIDIGPIKEFNLTICIGKEWYRFPGHYLVPDGVRVDWIKSEFDGQLPAHFAVTDGGLANRIHGTSIIPPGLNDLNKEEPMHYVDVATCDYLVDLDFPHDPITSLYEPRYAVDSDTWDRVACLPFLDSRHSSLLTRTLWLPGENWKKMNSFGDYCLLRNRERVEKKMNDVVRSHAS